MSIHSLMIRAPAKINLFLHILNQKPNGYHTLQTLFQFIDLYDVLHIQTRRDKAIQFKGDTCLVPEQDQLVIKAAQLLQNHCQCPWGADIHLTKNIPMEAGLGGGSSDAAATLLALNTLWDCRLSLETLQQLGLTLGADVPIFIYGHSAFASGIGEQLTRAFPAEQHYVIAKPKCGISTKLVFNHTELPRNTPAIDFTSYAYQLTHNDCERLVRALYPPVEEVCQWLSTYGQPRLTGTGACVFLPLNDLNLWPSIQANCLNDCELWLCRGINDSPALLDLAKHNHAPALNE